ncbi:MAG: PPC domain-containing protein [Thermoguttaceae bacterium]
MPRIFVMILVLVFATSPLLAQQAASEVRVGYLYPTGGQRGTTVRVLVCGKQVSRATGAFVSGSGVHCRIVDSYPSMFVNDADQRNVIRQEFTAAARRFTGQDDAAPRERREEKKEKPKDNGNKDAGTKTDATKDTATQVVEVPTFSQLVRRYPYLRELESPTADGLQLVFYEYFAPRNDRRPKEALAQGLMLEVTIDSDAAIGRRELRIVTQRGTAPPVTFVVGDIKEVCEQEPNDVASETLHKSEAWNPRRMMNTFGNVVSGSEIAWTWRELPPQSLPVVFSGQIRSGDVDRLTFRAEAGTKIVLDVAARSLVPYLADAVPGWFQAAIALHDPSGKLVAEASSYRNDPDPLIVYEVGESGVYTVIVTDSVFRGREDFVYRLTVGELADAMLRHSRVLGGNDGEGVGEVNQSGKRKRATTSTLPVVASGVIETAGEVDEFSFDGKEGESVVIDVAARRLGSSLDATAEIVDATGKIVAANDDRADSSGPNIGLETHHADPYILATLPATGVYTVRIFGADSSCGDDYGYRVLIAPPLPTCSLYTTSSNLNFLMSKTQPLTVRVFRLDGFAGEVRIRVAESDAKFFSIDSTTIAADANEATFKVTYKGTERGGVRSLKLEAVFGVDGREKVVNVVAADDREQAFIYHHLIPAEEIFVVEPVR